MIAARHRNFRNPNQREMSDRSFHLEEMKRPLPMYIYTYIYTRDIEALVKRLCARGMALTRDRDDLQLLNSLEAARSPHVPARIQVSEPGER